jgi:hypothetical protein
MAANKRITLVNGYHAQTPVPNSAMAANLGYRFAVVFHTDREDVDCMCFDAMLFCDVVQQMSAQIAHDELHINANDAAALKSLDELRATYTNMREEDRQPPRRIQFLKSGRLSCIEDTEFWVTCGGPQPYSDSYTASFYTRADMSATFSTACHGACEHCDFTTIDAADRPVTVPWWKRLLR